MSSATASSAQPPPVPDDVLLLLEQALSNDDYLLDEAYNFRLTADDSDDSDGDTDTRDDFGLVMEDSRKLAVDQIRPAGSSAAGSRYTSPRTVTSISSGDDIPVIDPFADGEEDFALGSSSLTAAGQTLKPVSQPPSMPATARSSRSPPTSSRLHAAMQRNSSFSSRVARDDELESEIQKRGLRRRDLLRTLRSIILVQCAARRFLALRRRNKELVSKLIAEDEKEEVERQRKAAEGLAFLDAVASKQKAADQIVLERHHKRASTNAVRAIERFWTLHRANFLENKARRQREKQQKLEQQRAVDGKNQHGPVPSSGGAPSHLDRSPEDEKTVELRKLLEEALREEEEAQRRQTEEGLKFLDSKRLEQKEADEEYLRKMHEFENASAFVIQRCYRLFRQRRRRKTSTKQGQDSSATTDADAAPSPLLADGAQLQTYSSSLKLPRTPMAHISLQTDLGASLSESAVQCDAADSLLQDRVGLIDRDVQTDAPLAQLNPQQLEQEQREENEKMLCDLRGLVQAELASVEQRVRHAVMLANEETLANLVSKPVLSQQPLPPAASRLHCEITSQLVLSGIRKDRASRHQQYMSELQELAVADQEFIRGRDRGMSEPAAAAAAVPESSSRAGQQLATSSFGETLEPDQEEEPTHGEILHRVHRRFLAQQQGKKSLVHSVFSSPALSRHLPSSASPAGDRRSPARVQSAHGAGNAVRLPLSTSLPPASSSSSAVAAAATKPLWMQQMEAFDRHQQQKYVEWREHRMKKLKDKDDTQRLSDLLRRQDELLERMERFQL